MLDEKILADIWDDIENQNKKYFETGFDELDEIIKIRGNQGALIAIGARPAMGKTTFMLSLIEKISQSGKKVLGFSLEMNIEQIVKRQLCMLAEVSMHKVREGQLCASEYEKLAEAMDKILKWDLTIDDTPANTVEAIEQKIQEVKPEVVFIDYLQLLEGKRRHDRVSQIDDIMKDLKRISKEYGVVIIVLSQLSRALENRYDKRPLLSDFRQSGSIEYVSDVVLFIYREEYYTQFDDDNEIRVKGETEVIVAKNKFGGCGNVYLYFKAEIPKFYSGRSRLNEIF